MKDLLYFMVGLLALPLLAFGKIRNLGEIAVSNYNFGRRMKKNLKGRA